MALNQLPTTIEQGKGEQVEYIVSGTAAVVSNVVNFPNLATALQQLVTLLRDSEDKRLAAARVVQAIDRQQLYREQGFETMKDFYPVLLQQTASVGWQAERTVKMWLAFANLYLDQLSFDERIAMRANSHLHAAYVLAEVDRKSGELVDSPEKEGKLGAVEFEDVARVLAGLVTAPTPQQKMSGLDEDATKALLVQAGVPTAAIETFETRARMKVRLPQAGWTVADTKTAIERIKGEKDELKVRQVWHLSFADDVQVEVDRLVWEAELPVLDPETKEPVKGEDGKVVKEWTQTNELPWNPKDRIIPVKRFEAMSKGDVVVNDNEEGEE